MQGVFGLKNYLKSGIGQFNRTCTFEEFLFYIFTDGSTTLKHSPEKSHIKNLV
jgi:hypothetical protein